uniref:C2H2-type domain-containing protein n=1 Tax=Plectus sambesii TaxID=2011161 RepID=A0A914XQ69_9BILA
MLAFLDWRRMTNGLLQTREWSPLESPPGATMDGGWTGSGVLADHGQADLASMSHYGMAGATDGSKWPGLDPAGGGTLAAHHVVKSHFQVPFHGSSNLPVSLVAGFPRCPSNGSADQYASQQGHRPTPAWQGIRLPTVSPTQPQIAGFQRPANSNGNEHHSVGGYFGQHQPIHSHQSAGHGWLPQSQSNIPLQTPQDKLPQLPFPSAHLYSTMADDSKLVAEQQQQQAARLAAVGQSSDGRHHFYSTYKSQQSPVSHGFPLRSPPSGDSIAATTAHLQSELDMIRQHQQQQQQQQCMAAAINQAVSTHAAWSSSQMPPINTSPAVVDAPAMKQSTPQGNGAHPAPSSASTSPAFQQISPASTPTPSCSDPIVDVVGTTTNPSHSQESPITSQGPSLSDIRAPPRPHSAVDSGIADACLDHDPQLRRPAIDSSHTPHSHGTVTPSLADSSTAFQHTITTVPASIVAAADANRIAALRLEEKIMHEAMGIISPPSTQLLSPPLSRPPGLGPSPSILTTFSSSLPSGTALAAGTAGGPTVYECNICGFRSASKFHYNSHMNTHTDHQCSMCDYTSRTEGRLKRHMKEFHSRAEQRAVGLEPEEPTPVSTPTTGSTDTQPQPSALEQMQAFAEKPQLMPDTTGSTLASALGMPMTTCVTPDNSLQAQSDSSRRSASVSSKPKTYRCKQCGHVSTSKEDSWSHARTHIPPEKQLGCPKCDFVTEYKHHLEYHLRNHFGSKPFQCKKCNYSCVNKSMLNSHMKSHSNFYQYRCSDCTYATKYCHSLKLHLRKYGHRPTTVIQGDGQSPMDPFGHHMNSNSNSPPPTTVHPQSHSIAQTLSSFLPQLSNQGVVTSDSMFPSNSLLPNLLARQQQIEAAMHAHARATMGVTLPAVPSSQFGGMSASAINDELIKQSMQHHLNNMAGDNLNLAHIYQSFTQNAGLQSTMPATTSASSDGRPSSGNHQSGDPSGSDEPELSTGHSPGTNEGSAESSGSPVGSGKCSGDESGNGAETPAGGSSRRKGKAYKLDQIARRLQGKLSPSHSGSSAPEDQDMDTSNRMGSEHDALKLNDDAASSSRQQIAINPLQQAQAYFAAINAALIQDREKQRVAVESAQQQQQQQQQQQLSGAQSGSWRFVCQHCRIAFENQVLYTIHMGYHGYELPFKCNRCGHVANDGLSFNLHLLQAPHD